MKASTTKLSLDYLREHGYTVDVVERWVPNPVGGNQVKRDLFGFLDLVAVRDDETLGVQTTSRPHLAERARKIVVAPAYPALITAGWRIVVHGWWQPRGPRTRYEVHVLEVGYDSNTVAR